LNIILNTFHDVWGLINSNSTFNNAYMWVVALEENKTLYKRFRQAEKEKK